MANSNAAFGLIPIKDSTGGYLRTQAYYAPASLASLGMGTPVALGGTANAVSNVNGASYPQGSLPSIVIATGADNTPFLGSIVSMDPIPTSPLTGNYNTASTQRVVWVADHPDQRFICKDNGANALAATNIGQNVNLTIGTVNSSTFVDSTVLNTASPATTQTFQMKILNLYPQPGNTIGIVDAVYEVMINQHQLANNTAGV